MKRYVVWGTAFAFLLFLSTPLPLRAAQERRKGAAEDMNWGNGTFYDSTGFPLSKINMNTIPFPQDNTIKGGNTNAYKAASGVATAYSIPFYDSAGTLQFLSFSGTGLCVKVTSATGTLELGTCGTGSGVASLDNTTMDNTIIGDNVATRARFTQLVVTDNGTVQNDKPLRLGTDGWAVRYDSANKRIVWYTPQVIGVNNSTPMYSIQVNSDNATLQTGQRVFSIMDGTTHVGYFVKSSTGVYDFYLLGGVVASQYSTTGSDNSFYINVANTSDPTVPASDNNICQYNKTSMQWKCYNGSSWDAMGGFSTLTYGSAPVVDSAGKAAVDNTADQLVYYGTGERVLTYRYVKDFVIYNYSASHDNVVKFKADTNWTLTQLDCITGGTDNVTVTLYECDSNATNCVTTGLSVTATSSNTSDATATNASIDVDDWVKVNLTSIQGTPTSVACSVRYTITRQ